MGKNFKSKVYQVVAKIRKGQVLSYKKVAEMAGNRKAARAVGNILNRHNVKNLPCHRVVCSNGYVGGYRGGIRKKTELLKKEGVKIDDKGRINLLCFLH